jgi:type IV fimbrial biogenesis protein FimT
MAGQLSQLRDDHREHGGGACSGLRRWLGNRRIQHVLLFHRGRCRGREFRDSLLVNRHCNRIAGRRREVRDLDAGSFWRPVQLHLHRHVAREQVLEPLTMSTAARTAARGFTMIEMMVVVVLAAVLLAVAVPSFQSVIARKRLEGVANELSTDIHYARAEAIQRNAVVGIVFGTDCYVVYVLDSSSDATSCTSLGAGGVSLKSVQITGGSVLNFVPPSPRAFMAFDPVRGMAVDATGVTDLSGDVMLTNSGGNWQIQARVTRVGRVKLCSPNNTITSLATDCSVT